MPTKPRRKKDETGQTTLYESKPKNKSKDTKSKFNLWNRTDSTGRDDEKRMAIIVKIDVYEKIKQISIAEKRMMKDIHNECLEDMVAKKVKEGIIDSDGNILKS